MNGKFFDLKKEKQDRMINAALKVFAQQGYRHASTPFSEEIAKQVLLEKEIEILVELNSGDVSSTAWGCDLTYDYVKINGDYRT